MNNKITFFAAALLLSVFLVNAQIVNYDSYGNGSLRLLSERYKEWSTQTFEWDDSDSSTYNYNAQGLENEKRTYFSPANTWNYTKIKTQTYTSTGKPLLVTDSNLTSSLGCNRYAYNYNANDQEIMLQSERVSSGNWVLQARTQTNYTAFDSVNVELTQFYVNSNWENTYRTVHTYNPQNRDTLGTYETWKSNQWRGESRVTTPLNSNGQPVSATNQKYDTLSATYKNYSQNLYTYNVDNRLATTTYRLWSASLNDWVNVTKSTYAYDTNGNLENGLGESWNLQTLGWDLSTLNTYTYNAGNMLTNFLYQTRDGSTWKNYSEAIYTYNTQGYITNYLQQGWDDNTLAWRNYSDWAYYYEANPLSSITETERTKLFVFPNPSNSPVVFVSADRNLPYALYDMQGRMIQQGSLQQGTNSIILNETKGNYLLKAGNSSTILVKQ